MKPLKSLILLVAIASATILFPACKAKKLAAKPAPAPEAPAPPPAPPAPAPAPPTPPPPPPAPPKPDYNFSNIQFDFDSPILKTASFPILDQAASAMKADPSVKFVLNGNASSEGTPEHNQELSVQRAQAVKTYLVNSGVSDANLTVVGYGDTKPIASNDTEEGRVLNRRVEIKVTH
jgi:OOP family OmpA-OmpF porin